MAIRKKMPLIGFFLLIIALFLIPVIGAKFLFKHGHDLIRKQVNHGQLILPPVDFSEFVLRDTKGDLIDQEILRGKWWLVYVEPSKACMESCKRHLFFMRQTRIALGKNRNRLNNLFVTFQSISLPDGFQGLGIQYGQTDQQMLKSGIQSKLHLGQGGFYLVDPLGNLMMSYPLDVNPGFILKDLKRLLKVSQIG